MGCAIPSKTPPFRGGWTRQQSANRYHLNRSETTLMSFTPSSLTHFISPFSRPVRRHLPIPTGPSIVHLQHLCEHVLAILTELFNLSVAVVNIPAIWKNSVTIPILKVGKRRGQGHSYRPISLFCPAVKILERHRGGPG